MSKIFFFNGKYVPEEEAVVPVTTHALHYGTGNYEGIRAYYSEEGKCLYAFRVEDHFKRMVESTKIMHIKLPGTPEELTEITKELLKKNFSETDVYIRPLAYKSDPAIGNFNLDKLADGFAMYCIPLGRHYGEKSGLKANISSWVRVSNKAIPPKGKITGAYANTCLAKTESAGLGFDEAFFLDHEGFVVEGSAENLFIIKNGTIFTPPSTADILVGITRDTIIQILKKEFGLEVEEKKITLEELKNADEIFVCGTGSEIAGVVQVEDQIIRNGETGEWTEKIINLYSEIVHGKNPKYSNWITKVDR
jgi:branched-chain amino acid aminotransferase